MAVAGLRSPTALTRRVLASMATGRFAGVGRPVEVTVAVGASLFDARFGLGSWRPRGLVEMPAFPNDVLDPARCHGDLLLQVGAADTATARSVVDELAGADLVPRWQVEGHTRWHCSASPDDFAGALVPGVPQLVPGPGLRIIGVSSANRSEQREEACH